MPSSSLLGVHPHDAPHRSGSRLHGPFQRRPVLTPGVCGYLVGYRPGPGFVGEQPFRLWIWQRRWGQRKGCSICKVFRHDVPLACLLLQHLLAQCVHKLVCVANEAQRQSDFAFRGGTGLFGTTPPAQSSNVRGFKQSRNIRSRVGFSNGVYS